MIHYKDMTFCESNCVNYNCNRNLTKEVRQEAIQWWGTQNPPISTGDFTHICEDYKEPH